MQTEVRQHGISSNRGFNREQNYKYRCLTRRTFNSEDKYCARVMCSPMFAAPHRQLNMLCPATALMAEPWSKFGYELPALEMLRVF